MHKNAVLIPVDVLQHFMVDVFTGAGVPRPDAEICAEVLITSDLRGIESHGIKSKQIEPVARETIVREGPTSAVIDGNHGLGHVIGYRAMSMAIRKAKQYGMGAVAVRNSTHFGIDGFYPLMAVKAGLVGMSFTNARPSISPTFGVRPMMGTNPIAFGAPTDEDCPFLFDAATSITQRGKIEVLTRDDKPTPAGWVIDQNNGFLTDSPAILTGLSAESAALLPLGGVGEEMGGHKGYGLAAMVEIFSAAFQTGAFLHALSGLDADGKPARFKVGHFFMAMDVEQFVPLEEFKHTTGEIVRQLRASPKAPGCERIYSAGEKEYENEQRVRLDGVAVVTVLQKEMKIMQQELGLWQYSLPF
jgi:L-2-hydroxycarboxylate dehydrogenase (NAD+)